MSNTLENLRKQVSELEPVRKTTEEIVSIDRRDFIERNDLGERAIKDLDELIKRVKLLGGLNIQIGTIYRVFKRCGEKTEKGKK